MVLLDIEVLWYISILHSRKQAVIINEMNYYCSEQFINYYLSKYLFVKIINEWIISDMIQDFGKI
jgi:hypothetical protein